MSDPTFRGVVLGSAWRRMHQMIPRDVLVANRAAIAKGLPVPGAFTNYVPQRHAVEPLIRRSLFYFDKIALPTNNLVLLDDVGGVEYLIGEGELETEHIDLRLTREEIERTRHIINLNMALTIRGPVNPAEQLIQFHRQVFAVRQAIQPNQWSLASVGEGLEFSTEKTVRGYQMALVECVPIPLDLASYADIIEFKKRERNALLRLRAELDRIYVEITKSSDLEFAANISTVDLKAAIRDVCELLDKSRLPWGMQSFEVDFSPATWATAAMAAHDAAEWLEKWSVPAPLAHAGGAALAARLMIKRTEVQPPADVHGPFRYIYKAAQAGIVGKVQV
jgi:hypothetical protein